MPLRRRSFVKFLGASPGLLPSVSFPEASPVHVPSLAATDMAQGVTGSGNLVHVPQWAIFYDFHTEPAQPDVGLNFDAEDFARRLRRCGVDYTVFHA